MDEETEVFGNSEVKANDRQVGCVSNMIDESARRWAEEYKAC